MSTAYRHRMYRSWLLWVFLLWLAVGCSDRWSPSSSSCALSDHPDIVQDQRWRQADGVKYVHSCLRVFWPQASHVETQLVIVMADGTVLNPRTDGTDGLPPKAPLTLHFATKGRFGDEQPQLELLVFSDQTDRSQHQAICQGEMQKIQYQCQGPGGEACWFGWHQTLGAQGDQQTCRLLTPDSAARIEPSETTGEGTQEPPDASLEADVPDAPDPSDRSDTRDVPEGPDGVDTTDIPALPDDADASDSPDGPDAPNLPDTGCTPNTSRSCSVPGQQGECAQGTQLCDAQGKPGPCKASSNGAPERCDGIDNDCDGSIDEDGICGSSCPARPCVVTVAGPTGLFPPSGSKIRVSEPSDFVFDAKGIMYVVDRGLHQILRVNLAQQTITVYAGSGKAGQNDGALLQAQFNQPTSIAIDDKGNLFVADTANHATRRIDRASGSVSTLHRESGLDPVGIAFDSKKQWLFYSSRQQQVIHKHDLSARKMSILAGVKGQTGYINGAGTVARFYEPAGLALDQLGALYVADTQNHVIRKIDTSNGQVSTYAGDGTSGATNDVWNKASFTLPWGLAHDGIGTLYVSDLGNHLIRAITSQGRVISVTTQTKAGFLDGPSKDALLNTPWGLAVGPGNQLYVADYNNGAIRKIALSTNAQPVNTITQREGKGYREGPAQEVLFNEPTGLTIDILRGKLYISDAQNHRIRTLNLFTGATSLFSGSGQQGTATGSSTVTQYNRPSGLWLQPSGGLWVTDENNHRILSLDTKGISTRFAGVSKGFADGPTSSAKFLSPSSVAFRRITGELIVADTENHCIRAISRQNVKVLAGALTAAKDKCEQGSLDSHRLTATFKAPSGLVIGSLGNIYVADTGNHTIRKIDGISGKVTTIAGLAGSASLVDGKPTDARFRSPQGLAIDVLGRIYVADTGNNAIRMIDLGKKLVSTIAGGCGNLGCSGYLDGLAHQARFRSPTDIAVDILGHLYIADSKNNNIRKLLR